MPCPLHPTLTLRTRKLALPTSHWHEVSRAVDLVGVERADGGEDDQDEGQQKDLPEMGWGHPILPLLCEHPELTDRETEVQLSEGGSQEEAETFYFILDMLVIGTALLCSQADL